MRKLVRRGIEELIPYPPGKPLEELERELGIRGSIKLASNENPLGPSPMAVEAIVEKLQSLNRYPDGSGYYLKEKLSRKFGVPADRVLLGNGSNELIELLVRTFLSNGETAIQPFPTFLVYEKIVTGAGGRITTIPLENFRINLENVVQAVTPLTKIIFINNPNNPTGSGLPKQELLRFLDQIPKDVIVALDEAYIEFAEDPAIISGVEFLDAHPLLLVLRTFSKLYGLAGLRIGYGFASAEMVNYMNRVRQPFNANSLAQAAAIAALDDTAFVDRTLRLVREGLKYLQESLDRMGFRYVPTQTNFFLIEIPEGGKQIYERLLREGVIVRAMDSYGIENYIRINAGLMEENERFIKALKKVAGR